MYEGPLGMSIGGTHIYNSPHVCVSPVLRPHKLIDPPISTYAPEAFLSVPMGLPLGQG